MRRAFERAGKILDDLDPEPGSLAVEDSALATLYGASVAGHVAMGLRVRAVERMGDRVTVDDAEQLTPVVVHSAGLSLHADVAIPVRDRRRLNRLLRYIARPPGTERLDRRPDGKLLYLFRKP